MRARLLFALVLAALAGWSWYGLAPHDSLAQEKKGAVEKKAAPAEEKAVHRTMEELVNAFNGADAKGVAAVFTTEAEFVDDQGNGVKGKGEIEKLFLKFLAANKGAKLQVTLDGLRLVAPTVALEDGESVVTVPDKGTQSARRYAMVFVKQGEKWLVASVREFPEADANPTPNERLQALEWLVGDWVDESGDAVVATSCRWSDDKNYLLRDFTIKVQGKDTMKGTQRIGVDPLTGQIKGWVFDSQGGNGETVWVKDGEQWLVKATGVTSEGETANATYLLKPVGKDRIVWKTMHRVVGDRVEPDLEITVVRKPPLPK